MKIRSFTATLEIIGVNPFVFVPEKILQSIFKAAGKEKGHIPVCGEVNGKSYKQTLVKYSGHWRLYINTSMLKDSPKRIGEKLKIQVQFDPEIREIAIPALFTKALSQNKKAKTVFEKLPPSRRKEIVRYLAHLKTEQSLKRNIDRAIAFLEGKERFVGRDHPVSK